MIERRGAAIHGGLLMALAGALACSNEATPAGLEVIIATNMSAPAEYDAIEVAVSQESDAGSWRSVLDQTYSVPSQARLPTTLSIAPGRSPNQTALIVITASHGGKRVVVREAELSIPEDRVAELVMVLSASCAYVTCSDASESCQPATGQCGPTAIDASTLPTYEPGDVDRVDAGAEASLPSVADARPSDATLSDAHDAPAPPSDGPVACTTLYVTIAGSDTNTGCSGTTPKRTIAAALAAARVVSSPAPTIEVCSGTYVETALTFDFPATLLGGYDCTTPSAWTRPSDEGYESFTPAAYLTVIENADVSTQAATLNVAGASEIVALTIDGFSIYSATSNATPFSGTVSAVSCTGNVTPTISSCVLVPDPTGVSGFTGGATVSSRGVAVANGASPELLFNQIAAGIGAGSNSFGVATDGSALTLTVRGNTINGGSGPLASYGLYLPGPVVDAGTTAHFTVVGNAISGGTGPSSDGIVVRGAMTLTLDSNAIVAAPAPAADAGTGCGAAVNIDATGLAIITRNRIYSQTCDHQGGAGSGILLNGLASPEVYNNMVWAGDVTQPAANSATVALKLTSVTNADVRFNTLVGGVSVAGGVSKGITASVWVEPGTTGLTLSDNIFAGEADGDAGIALIVPCTPDGGMGGVHAFENNALLNAPLALVRSQCPGTVKYVTLKTALDELTLTGASVGAGNVLFARSCADAGSSCAASPVCTSPSTCLSEMFAGWDVATGGVVNLTQFVQDAGCLPDGGGGWALSNSAPCQVTRGGAADSGITSDIHGACRSTMGPSSMGASEHSGPCAMDGM